MNQRHMPTDRIHAACAALLEIDGLSAESTRSLYLRETCTALGRMLTVTRYPQPNLDLYSILRACELERGGLAAWFRVLDSFHQGSSALGSARQIIEDWVHETWEELLVELLAGVPVATVAGAVTAAGGTLVAGTDVADLIAVVGWQESARWGTPQLLAVAELLAYEPALAASLRQWLADVSARLGIEARTVTAMQKAVAHHKDLSVSVAGITGPNLAVESDTEPDMRKTIIIEQTPIPVAQTLIRGREPTRNPNFTGRTSLLTALETALKSQQRASVLPQTLHGLGGVGKTQVTIEYTYRHSDEYQLIWWIAAEEPTAVRSSLSALAGRLGLPAGPSMDQTVRTVIDTLATAQLSWLLVYDNADELADLDGLIPAAGGHVIITSRNPDWADWSAAGAAFEVDVFTRSESTALLRKRRPEMSELDADRLAERLGDLPLALEQAVSWLITTLISVDHYLAEFERQSRALLKEGRPRQYPTTVLTFVAIALKNLRQNASVAAMLLELMAFLGPDPISPSLLWAGRRADVTEPLRSALGERIEIGRAVRDLGRFGLARVDSPGQRIQVHRLVQLVLREELIEERREDGRRNARALLAAANPGYPDKQETWPRHAEIAPHVRATGLIEGNLEERRALMDHLRYLYNIGDYEGCRDLAGEIVAAWTRPVDEGGHPADDPLTLLARRRYADALRSLGGFPKARELAQQVLDDMRDALGEQHEYTLGARIGVGADMRIAGDVAAARELDERNLELHREALGSGDHSTLRAMLVVAIDRRMSGDMQAAYEIDVEAERLSRSALGQDDALTFWAISGQARDLYGLGRYAEALELQQQHLPSHITLLGPTHPQVLLADSGVAIALRKIGRLGDALIRAHENYRTHSVRFGAEHPHTLAATLTYANSLRAVGELSQARLLAISGYQGYQQLYGVRHPLTSCAAVNLAIIHRAENSDWDAMLLDEATLEIMQETLSGEHPYVLCLRSNWANNLARAHKLEKAREMSTQLHFVSQRVRGERHPYTLHCATNAALDMINTDDEVEGYVLLENTIAAMTDLFGADHPDVIAARQRKRAECDIEPPPW